MKNWNRDIRNFVNSCKLRGLSNAEIARELDHQAELETLTHMLSSQENLLAADTMLAACDVDIRRAA